MLLYTIKCKVMKSLRKLNKRDYIINVRKYQEHKPYIIADMTGKAVYCHNKNM